MVLPLQRQGVSRLEYHDQPCNLTNTTFAEFTICTIIKSKIQIGTIFSYVTTVNGFTEEIVLEKHKVGLD